MCRLKLLIWELASFDMSRNHCFVKCDVCGCYGHTGRSCALAKLNSEMEAREHKKHSDRISLGLTPELEQEIAKIRAAWRIPTEAIQ